MSQQLGDCYEAALEFLMQSCLGPRWELEIFNEDIDLEDCPLRLVHAEVVGQGRLDGVRYGHAFVLDPEKRMVHERAMGRELVIPQQYYYQLGQIDDSPEAQEALKYIEYDAEEALRMLREFKHYGPWELETEL